MHPSMLAKRGTVFLLVVIVAFYFFGLGHLPLVGPDEPRYAEVAREMFVRHDLVTPTLGGYTWFEKPALLYWMMILSFKLFGVTEWAARLPAVFSGLLTVAAVFVFAFRVERNADSDSELQGYAFWSVLAAATMIGTIAFSRAASFDILLTMTTTWALAFYLLYDFDEASPLDSKQNGKRRLWFLAGFYAFIGLSLLAKGLIGIVIPVGVLGFYHLFQRRLPGRKLLISALWGLPLALGVAATWYAPVIRRHGSPFIDEFFIQHHFARYISNKYHHSQPVYYYLLVVPLLTLPWTAFLFDGLLASRRCLIQGGNYRDPTADNCNRLMLFALAWLLFPLLFFSFSNSKLPGYILPVLPAAALIVGERLVRLYRRSAAREWPIGATSILSVLFAVGVIVYARQTGDLKIAYACLVAVPALVASYFGYFHRQQLMTVALLSFPAATLAALIVALLWVAPSIAGAESSKHLLQLADARGYSQAAIYGMQRSDRTPEFYAFGRIAYGADGEPIMYEGPEQVLDESRRRNEVLLTIVPIGKVSRLTDMAAAQTEVIGSNGRYALVAVRAR
ncbi:MAG: glycosyltransferase family 39 protein [Acidobacteriota bacterium]